MHHTLSRLCIRVSLRVSHRLGFVEALERLGSRDPRVLRTLSSAAQQHRNDHTNETDDNSCQKTNNDVAVPDEGAVVGGRRVRVVITEGSGNSLGTS